MLFVKLRIVIIITLAKSLFTDNQYMSQVTFAFEKVTELILLFYKEINIKGINLKC